MALNPGKSKCMVIGTRQNIKKTRRSYAKNEMVLENDIKVLGICIYN
jgi:hypothetical protein